MKNKKVPLFVLLLLPLVSVACSLLLEAPIATPTQETKPHIKSLPDPLMIEPASLPEAQVGVMYESEIHITQNVTPVGDMWIKEGALPVGLEFVFQKGQDAAKISGIPQETGIFSITLYAWCFGTMVSGQTLQKEYQMVVNK